MASVNKHFRSVQKPFFAFLDLRLSEYVDNSTTSMNEGFTKASFKSLTTNLIAFKTGKTNRFSALEKAVSLFT